MVIKFRDNVVKDIREFIKDNGIRSVWLDMDGVVLRSGDQFSH